jgi:type IV secretory pathway VirB10-like protein
MFQTILIGISLVVLASIGYVVFRAYWNQTKEKEDFQNSIRASQPAPVEPPKIAVSPEPPQVVAPAGPNPPSAAPSKKVTFAPQEQPHDPFDETEGETPMRDSLRHPERSFGPGVDNVETRIAPLSGVANEVAAKNSSTFSPDFAQNGGEFMKGISANDTFDDTTYANA